jgi:hypothetical protein
VWQQLTLPFPLFHSPSLPLPTHENNVRGRLYATYHTHTSPYVYIGRIRFMVFPPATSKATLIYVGEFLYYTFNVYVLPRSLYLYLYPCSLYSLYIYTLKLQPKVIFFSIYIYTFICIRFYLYDLRRLRGSYIGSLIIYIRYTYYIKGNLCIRSATSFLALREPRAVDFGLRP